MSEQETYIEITGNIIVHHPIKREALVIQFTPQFIKEWNAIVLERTREAA